jgi:hypothetical protein
LENIQKFTVKERKGIQFITLGFVMVQNNIRLCIKLLCI